MASAISLKSRRASGANDCASGHDAKLPDIMRARSFLSTVTSGCVPHGTNRFHHPDAHIVVPWTRVVIVDDDGKLLRCASTPSPS
jgi:hypothetical protein